MRRVVSSGSHSLELLERGDRREGDRVLRFADRHAAEQQVRRLWADPEARRVLLRALGGSASAAGGPTSLGTAGAMAELVRRLLDGRLALSRRQEVVPASLESAGDDDEEGSAPEEEPEAPKVFDLRLIRVTPHFAPGSRIYPNGDMESPSDGERCAVEYQVVDPSGLATSGTLEVLRRSAGTVLFRIDLNPGQYSHGTHTYSWNGAGNQGGMAGKYVHLLHSPYTVRVTVTGLGVKRVEGQTAVLLEELSLSRGAYPEDGETPPAGSTRHYQLRLIQLGFHVGAVDGSVGPQTRRAIRAFQRHLGYLRVNGRLDTNTKAALDGEAPAGSGTSHYQFILNYLGFFCGRIDGIAGKKTRHAVERYKTLRGIAPPNGTLDGTTRGRLDGEALAPLTPVEVLEGDAAAADVTKNPLPARGSEKKLYVRCEDTWSVSPMPYNQKYDHEQQRLIRPTFPLVARPLVKTSGGGKAFAPEAVERLRVDFSVDTTAPPADLGIDHPTARAYVQAALAVDGGQAQSGHHVHKNRGGVRDTADPGCFVAGSAYKPYQVQRAGHLHRCTCVTEDKPARGSAGVFFRPSTIGGDRFSVVAQVNSQGFDTPPATLPRAQSGALWVWRRYRVAKRWYMDYVTRPHVSQNAHLDVDDFYDAAYIELQDPVAPNPLMIVPRSPDRDNIDVPLYTYLLREAGFTAAQLPDAQIVARFNDGILYPLTPAAVYTPPNTQAYHQAVEAEIDAFEGRFMRTLREVSDTEANEGLVLLVIVQNAPTPGTHGIPAGVGGWSWSVFPERRTVLLLETMRDSVVAEENQTAALAHDETWTFEDYGCFAGLPAAQRTITFPAGSTQAQVETAVATHAQIGTRVIAWSSGNYLRVEAHNATDAFRVTSDRPAANDSTGLGRVRQGYIGPEQTLAHELGHALWLHHASTDAGDDPWGSDQSEHHDEEWRNCTMTYLTMDHFCGKCLIKLRGWDQQQVGNHL